MLILLARDSLRRLNRLGKKEEEKFSSFGISRRSSELTRLNQPGESGVIVVVLPANRSAIGVFAVPGRAD